MSQGPRGFLLVRFPNAGHRRCIRRQTHAKARIEKPPTKLPFIDQSPSTNFAAMAHMTNAMPASKIRQAAGLAKIARSHAEP